MRVLSGGLVAVPLFLTPISGPFAGKNDRNAENPSSQNIPIKLIIQFSFREYLCSTHSVCWDQCTRRAHSRRGRSAEFNRSTLISQLTSIKQRGAKKTNAHIPLETRFLSADSDSMAAVQLYYLNFGSNALCLRV